MSDRVAILGTSGRGQDARRMSKDTYDRMLTKARAVMTDQLRVDPHAMTLVSGGSAWAEHVAVQLFLDGTVAGLELHLPCPLKKGQFLDNSGRSQLSNPGRALNALHQRFGRLIGRDTIADIEKAIARGARVVEKHQGFYARNSAIAASVQSLIAFSWGRDDCPSSTGALDAWNKCAPGVRKVHVSLWKAPHVVHHE